MNMIISGYGRMGKAVEEVCLSRGHQIEAVIDKLSDWESLDATHKNVVVIDFSMPEVAVDNIVRCFRWGWPVVAGTTGWYAHLPQVKETCASLNGALFYAPNFSIGVNILFTVNRLLAGMMASIEGYHPEITETHHVHKLDAPSGTAIRLAEDILHENPHLKEWKNSADDRPEILPVLSVRRGEVPGIHEVVYESEMDKLVLKHEAKSRKGFALGAVLAAEFLYGKKGVFTMDDYMKTLMG